MTRGGGLSLIKPRRSEEDKKRKEYGPDGATPSIPGVK